MSELLIQLAPKTSTDFDTEEDYHEFLDLWFLFYIERRTIPLEKRARMAESRMIQGDSCWLYQEF